MLRNRAYYGQKRACNAQVICLLCSSNVPIMLKKESYCAQKIFLLQCMLKKRSYYAQLTTDYKLVDQFEISLRVGMPIPSSKLISPLVQ